MLPMLPLLPVTVLIPLAFALLTVAFDERRALGVALVASVILFALAGAVAYIGFSSGFSSLSFNFPYVQSLLPLSLQATKYGVAFLIASALAFLASSIAAWSFIKESRKLYAILLLLMESATAGFLLSGSLFLFYAFWVIGEAAMFFLIYVFGGFNRRYAAIRFMVFSAVSSALLLVGILLLYANSPAHSFNIALLASQSSSVPAGFQLPIFLLLAFAFLIKMPTFPFHGWLPDAAEAAPATGNMLLSGVSLRFSSYGFIILLTILTLPASYAKYLAVLFSISAVYGALLMLSQTDLRRALAYANMVCASVIAIGIVSGNAAGTGGAVYAVLGFSALMPLLFLIIGAVDESYGTVLIGKVAGVAKDLPSLAYSFGFGTFAFVGLPLLGCFTGYFLVFSGAFAQFGAVGLLPAAAVAIVGAFMFFIMEKCMMDVSKSQEPSSAFGHGVSYAIILLVLSLLLLGIFPSLMSAL